MFHAGLTTHHFAWMKEAHWHYRSHPAPGDRPHRHLPRHATCLVAPLPERIEPRVRASDRGLAKKTK